MRPAKQVKVIASQLEVFQDMQIQLQNLLSYISDIIQKGVSWIEGLRNESYVEINQYLASETSECIKRCSAIPDSDEALLHDSASNENASKEYTLKSFSNLPETKDYVLLTEKMEILEKTISSYSKKMKVMQQKFLDNEEEINIKICRQVGETENKYDLKLQEIMKELHSASDFMLHLQGQNEILSGQVNKNEKQMTDILTSVESVQEKLSQIEQESASGCNQNVSEENVRSSEADEMSAVNTKLKALSSHYEMLSNKIMEHSQELQNISAANRVMQNLERDIKLFEEKYNQSNEEMKLKLQTADKKILGHQSASEALTTTVEEFRKTLNKTTEMLNYLKKDHLELSLQLSALKFFTDKSINKQGNKTNILENKMTSLDSKSLNVSSQVDKLSKEIVEL
ncbi:myosin-9-like isoform X2, partial [Biomphalaria pfeifferi]